MGGGAGGLPSVLLLDKGPQWLSFRSTSPTVIGCGGRV